jgi:transposase
VIERGYQLININNYKLAQFKKIFPGAAKSDAIDTRKMFELFTMRDHLPLAKNVMQPVVKASDESEKLKRLTRRRRSLVGEKVRVVNRLQSDLQAISPGLLEITGSIDNLWFLRFLGAREDLKQLAKIQSKSILKIKGVGKSYLAAITKWQETATFSTHIEWVGEMIISDAKRVLDLLSEINSLEAVIAKISTQSPIACRLKSISGFGEVCSAEIAGEIGAIDRFTSEASLALYLGMAVLENSSGKYEGTKKSKQVNIHAKFAMMTAMARHIANCDESKRYYDKKRSEGKKHNQAVRALGRHMVRVIWSMLKNDRDYFMNDR